MNQIEKIGKDILHGIEYPFVHTAKFIAVLGTLVKESTPVKDAIIALVRSAEAVDVDVVNAIVSKGLNLPEDLAAFKDVKSFFIAFRTQFLPVVEAAYKELQTDIKG